MVSTALNLLQSLTLRPLESGDRPRWDAWLQRQPNGHFMQSWAWSEFKALEGYHCFRYGIFAPSVVLQPTSPDKGLQPLVPAGEDELVGGAIFYYYPHHHRANLLFAPGAPCFQAGYEAAGMALLLQQAQQLAAELGAIALRIEPIASQKSDAFAAFVRAPVDLIPSETLLIDLQPSEAEILAQMRPKGRYNIGLSQRHGVTLHFSTDDQTIPRFYDLLWATAQRQSFFVEPYGFFINLCQTLFRANLGEIGLAYYGDRLLAAMLFIHWGDRTTYLYGGRATEHPEVMASYGLHWAAMQRAKARGSKLYDFYGFSRDPNHSYAKFSRFKRQFGGHIATLIGAHDHFFYDLLADTLLHLVQAVTSPKT